MSKLGLRIKELRISKDLTQSQLSKILGVGNTTVSMYENGNSTPDDDIKMKLATYFGVSLDYLMGNTDIRESADEILNKKEPTIALHSDYEYDELPDEAKKEIENFIEYVKAKYKK